MFFGTHSESNLYLFVIRSDLHSLYRLHICEYSVLLYKIYIARFLFIVSNIVKGLSMNTTSAKNKEFTSSVKKLRKGVFSSADKRCNAVKSLEALGDYDAIPYLLEALEKESDEKVRNRIIQAFGFFKDPNTTETLFELVFNESADDKETILCSLDLCISDQNLGFLIDSLSSGDIDRKKLSIQYLGKINTSDSIFTLLRCINDKDREIRDLASLTLSSFEDEDVIHCVTKIIENADRYFKIRLLQLVEEIKSPVSVPLLVHILKTNDVEVRSSAKKALSTSAKKESAVFLIDSLKDENFNVKCVAIKELLALGAEIPLSSLSELLEDENEHVRSHAVKALIAVSDEESLSLLEGVSNEDPDEWVRKLAQNHILKIRNQDLKTDTDKVNREIHEATRTLSERKKAISFCPYCGKNLDMDIAPLFCPFCGEQLVTSI